MKLASTLFSVFLVVHSSFHHEVKASRSNSGRYLRNKETKNAEVLTTYPLSLWDSRRKVQVVEDDDGASDDGEAWSHLGNGEELCENHGYSYDECVDIGDNCCQWSEALSCDSNIGPAICYKEPVDGKSACEGHGYGDSECNWVGSYDNPCCQFDYEANECLSAIGTEMCGNNYRTFTDDDDNWEGDPGKCIFSYDNGIHALLNEFSENNCEEYEAEIEPFTCSFEPSSLDELETVCNNAGGNIFYLSGTSIACEDAFGDVSTSLVLNPPLCLDHCNAEYLANLLDDVDYYRKTKEGCVYIDKADKIVVDGEEFRIVDFITDDNAGSHLGKGEEDEHEDDHDEDHEDDHDEGHKDDHDEGHEDDHDEDHHEDHDEDHHDDHEEDDDDFVPSKCVPPLVDNGIDESLNNFDEDNCENAEGGFDFSCSFEPSALDDIERVCNNVGGKLYYFSASVVCEDGPGAFFNTRLSVPPVCLTGLGCSAEHLAAWFDYEYYAVSREGCVFDTIDKIFGGGREFSLIDMMYVDTFTTVTSSQPLPKAHKTPKATKASKTSKAGKKKNRL